MQEIILTIGLPASGKTVWTNHLTQTNPDYVNINRDDIRLMLQGRERYNKFTKTREALVSTIQFSTAKHALLLGKSIVISDTNLNPAYKSKWEAFAKNFNDKHGIEVKYVEKSFTNVHLGVCLDRDKLRKFPVGSGVITGMFNKYQDIYWPKPEHDPELPNAYIVDVDGTIAHMHNRRAYDWAKVKDDTPKQNVIDIVNSLHTLGNKIIICSGRDGVSKDDTIDWLQENDVQFNEFFIRPAGDSRKDTIIKEEIYNDHIKGKYNVLGVFDDRNSVTWMWRQLGLTCLQVDFGDF